MRTQLPLLKGEQLPNFRPMSIVAIRSPISATAEYLFIMSQFSSDDITFSVLWLLRWLHESYSEYWVWSTNRNIFWGFSSRMARNPACLHILCRLNNSALWFLSKLPFASNLHCGMLRACVTFCEKNTCSSLWLFMLILTTVITRRRTCRIVYFVFASITVSSGST